MVYFCKKVVSNDSSTDVLGFMFHSSCFMPADCVPAPTAPTLPVSEMFEMGSFIESSSESSSESDGSEWAPGPNDGTSGSESDSKMVQDEAPLRAQKRKKDRTKPKGEISNSKSRRVGDGSSVAGPAIVGPGVFPEAVQVSSVSNYFDSRFRVNLWYFPVGLDFGAMISDNEIDSIRQSLKEKYTASRPPYSDAFIVRYKELCLFMKDKNRYPQQFKPEHDETKLKLWLNSTLRLVCSNKTPYYEAQGEFLGNLGIRGVSQTRAMEESDYPTFFGDILSAGCFPLAKFENVFESLPPFYLSLLGFKGVKVGVAWRQDYLEIRLAILHDPDLWGGLFEELVSKGQIDIKSTFHSTISRYFGRMQRVKGRNERAVVDYVFEDLERLTQFSRLYKRFCRFDSKFESKEGKAFVDYVGFLIDDGHLRFDMLYILFACKFSVPDQFDSFRLVFESIDIDMNPLLRQKNIDFSTIEFNSVDDVFEKMREFSLYSKSRDAAARLFEVWTLRQQNGKLSHALSTWITRTFSKFRRGHNTSLFVVRALEHLGYTTDLGGSRK